MAKGNKTEGDMRFTNLALRKVRVDGRAKRKMYRGKDLRTAVKGNKTDLRKGTWSLRKF